MNLPGARLLAEWRELNRFKGLPAAARRLVFYAEDQASWVHFQPVIHHLTETLGREICYVTSSPSDPILATDNPRIRPFLIGLGMVRTWFFSDLSAGVMVMTMPDLENLYIKRSRSHPVHYAYIFHSVVSTHMIYRRGAFDHYDTIFTVGPHHGAEIRATEKTYGLEPKALVEHGYGRLDTILDESSRHDSLLPLNARKIRVLVAPSWGPDGLIETRGPELAETILAAGCRLTVRPHPMTGKKWPQSISALDRFSEHPDFELELDISSQQSLLEADIMISDWSGAALEFAFGLERPVLFVDVPRKVNNPEYERIGCDPVEVSIRKRIGAVVAPNRLSSLGSEITRLCADREAFREKIRRVRAETVYNVGSSGKASAEQLSRLADESPLEQRAPKH